MPDQSVTPAGVLCPHCNSPTRPGETICPVCGGTLSTAGATRSEVALPAGTRLQSGKYLVGRMLGQGGFGITYLGSWPEMRQAVAVKEFFPAGSTRAGLMVQPPKGLNRQAYAESRARFLDEGRTLARFRHPGIVRVFDAFAENSTAYLVMEYLAGKTLEALRVERGGRMAEAEAVPLIRQVAEALAEVHAAGLLHRDIKPENIIVNSQNRPVLIDFGSAREFVSDRTMRQTTVLTQGYAPLEQYAGAARRGPYTDIYALAATLYHLLTGRLPPSATDRASGVDLPSPQAINPAISERTDRAILRAMEMEANRRPASMAQFLDLLAGKDELQTGLLPPLTISANGGNALQPGAPASAPTGQRRRAGRPLPPGMPPDYPESIVYLVEELSLYQPIEMQVFRCPVCRTGELSDPATGRIDRCPVCRQSDLVDRIPNRDRCPICRLGELRPVQVTTQGFSCPLCKYGWVMEQQVGREWLFLPRYLATCTGCGARYRRTLVGDRFTLESMPESAPQNALDVLYSTLPRAQWQALSGRTPVQRHCTHCAAQWDRGAHPDVWRLAVVPTPGSEPTIAPPSDGLNVLTWAKIAHGLTPEDASHLCGHCGAELDEQAGPVYRLRGARLDPYGVVLHYQGSTYDAVGWSRLANGKRTPEIGLLCPECTAEFSVPAAGDIAPTISAERQWRLEAFEPSRDQYGIGMRWRGMLLAEGDWRRLAAGRLRQTDEQQRLAELRAAVEGLIRQGDLTIAEAKTNFPSTLIPGEKPRLVFRAERQVGDQVDDRGLLWITTHRLFFQGANNRFDIPMELLNRIEAGSSDRLILGRADRSTLLVYHLYPVQTEVVLPGIRLAYHLGAPEAAKVIRVLR